MALIRTLIDPAGDFPTRTKESVEVIMQRLTGLDITCCPRCGKGRLRAMPLDRQPVAEAEKIDTS